MPTVVHRIRALAADDPGRPALFGPVRSEWRQLGRGIWWASVRQAAFGLSDLEIEPGAPVLLWSGARPEWAVAWPALCLAGARPVLLDPDAGEDALLEAVSDASLRVAVVSGRERLERVLRLREEGVVRLERVVTLDRTELPGSRLVDLEALIERGAPHLERSRTLLEGLDDEAVAAVLPGGQTLRHCDLATQTREGAGASLLVAASPASAAVLLAVVRAASRGSELWMAELVDELGPALAEVGPGELLLDEVRWRQVLAELERLADDTAGLEKQMVRLSRGAAGGEGPVGAVARSMLGPLLRAAGLGEARCWSPTRLPRELTEALAELGVAVQPAPGPDEPR